MSFQMEKLLDLALSHFKAERFEQAEELCTQVLAMAPANLEALYLAARSAYARKEHDLAFGRMQSLMDIDPDPAFFDDYCFIADASGNHGPALSFLNRLLEQRPDDADLCFRIGSLLHNSGEDEQAEETLQRAVTLDPQHQPALSLLADIAIARKEFETVEALLQRAIDSRPTLHDLNNMANLVKLQGRGDEADGYYRRSLALDPNNHLVYSNMLMNLLCTTQYTPEEIFEEHRRWGAAISSGVEAQRHVKSRYIAHSPERLRIGYVSADFYSHPVAFFMDPVLATHDRDAVDITIFSNVEREDDVTEQFRRMGHRWVDIRGLPDEEACQLIRDEGIHILVDLGGHTRNSRIGIFARRPAPLQVTWLGYANTTGLNTMDYRITDHLADPPGMTEHLHSEKLWRLPGSFNCYRPPRNPAEIQPLPAHSAGHVTFSAFHTFSKMNEPMFRLWARILKRAPDTRLLLKLPREQTDSLRHNTMRCFAEAGIAPERIELVPWLPLVHDHLRELGRMDIALDTFPYHGTTTTCESLFMGVPVVTLAGRAHVSRVGVSILAHAGLHELVANSEEEYVEKAVSLAGDINRLLAYRATLRQSLVRSPVMDLRGFVAQLEAAFREMWRIFLIS